MTQLDITIDRSRFDHHNEERFKLKVEPGLREDVVRLISENKNEPQWMLEKRLAGLKAFNALPMPDWGPSLAALDLNQITFFALPDAKSNAQKWDEVPADIKATFEKLGIPQAEQQALAGAGAQYDSGVVYHNLKKEWESKGVLFLDMDVALQEVPELVKKYFMTTCVPISLHKFAALHAAVWSGGTFLYVPKGVKVDQPLQAYFRMNAKRMGQFEHTLIIAEDGAQAAYIEGCSAPQYGTYSLHAGCVEVHVKPNARFRYSSIENWSKNTFNLNTKRAVVGENAIMEWVNGNLGSFITMLYPCSMLAGKGARSDYLGIAFAGNGQHQDTGCKMYHLAPNTTSTIRAKSISKDAGITSYRGLVRIIKGAQNAKCSVQCDALLLDEKAVSNTFPYMRITESSADVAHEATVGRISQETLFYLMSRGLSEEQALQLVVSGFIEPIAKELPLEYAVEFNRLIQLEMANAVG